MVFATNDSCSISGHNRIRDDLMVADEILVYIMILPGPFCTFANNLKCCLPCSNREHRAASPSGVPPFQGPLDCRRRYPSPCASKRDPRPAAVFLAGSLQAGRPGPRLNSSISGGQSATLSPMSITPGSLLERRGYRRYNSTWLQAGGACLRIEGRSAGDFCVEERTFAETRSSF